MDEKENVFKALHNERVTYKDPNDPNTRHVVFCSKCQSERIREKRIDEIEHVPMSMKTYTERMNKSTWIVNAVMRYSQWELQCLDCGYSVKYYKSM